MAKEYEEQELYQWWLDKADEEITPLSAKLVEYGGKGRAVDLVDIGRDLGRLQGRELTDGEASELGIYFYLRGKMGRWTAAVLRGEQISDDNLADIGIYVKMVQRIREKGGWPV